MTDRRISADVHANPRQDGMVIELPIRLGGVKTVVCLVLGDDGRLHISGPMNEPRLMYTLLQRAKAMLDEYQSTKLIQVANSVVGMKGNS